MAIDMSDYVDVAERLRDFRAEHPEGSLRPADPARPYWIETVGDKTFVVYAAAAYRNPGDPAPGIGVAWEPFPGKSSFTRDSELMNAETSAWGRAILAVGSSSAKRIASANEVRNRREDEASPAAVEPPNARAPESPGSAPAAGAVSAIAIRKQLAELATERHWPLDAVAGQFAEWSQGADIKTAKGSLLFEFLTQLRDGTVAVA